MNEKRFKLHHINDLTDQEYMRLKKITDNGELISLGEVVDLLNEQQSTIQFLQDEIDELKKDIDIYKYEEKKHSETARKLYEENEKLRNIHLSIDLTYSYGYGRYLADVRVIDGE